MNMMSINYEQYRTIIVSVLSILLPTFYTKGPSAAYLSRGLCCSAPPRRRMVTSGAPTDGKGIPHANTMLYLLQNNINALALQCQYGPI